MSESGSGEPVDSSADSGKDFSCPSCGNSYESNDGLRYHLQNHCTDVLIQCPSCDKGYETRTGLKQHHARSHENPLRFENTCEECGETFSVKESRQDARFCSRECNAEWRMGKFTGEDNPRWKSRVETTCKYCDGEFKTEQWLLEKGRSEFCSQECNAMWMSENLSGENSHHWKGGKQDYYGSNWLRQRGKALERDNHTCRDCGTTEDVEVHHITPIRKFDQPEQANKLRNLETLCRTCHRKWEGLYLRPDRC